MDSPGAYTLASLSLTTALSGQVQTTVDGLDGIAAATLECDFAYGSGGAACSVLAQVSLDGGTTFRDVARFDFTTAARSAWCNLNGLLSKGVTTYTALAAEGVNDGLLGPIWRGVVSSTGTYVNTTVGLRLSAR